MSTSETKPAPKDYRMGPKAGGWLTAWRAPAVLAAVGAVGSLLAFSGDASRFGYSYLFALMVILTMVFGALFLVIIQHFTAGHWGVTTRRIVEVVMSGAPLAAILAIPLFVGVATGQFHMYDEWMAGHGDHDDHAHEDEHDHDGEHEHEEGSEEATDEAAGDEHGSLLVPRTVHAQEHGADADHAEGHAHTPQMQAAHHHILQHKAAYLNVPGWFARALVYFLIWIGLALFFWRNSRKQDETKDLQLTIKMKAATPMAAILFGLSITFAAFDWMMALEPAWYSTIFGVVIFAGSCVSILAFTSIVGMSLAKNSLVGNAINTEHIHDIGKLLFGFMCFWTYVSFSQWMLIWYAGIPEEATWFHKRWDHGGWSVWSLSLLLGHFVFPFLFLVSRVVKRNFGLMAFGAAWLLGMHVADIYWYVLPQAGPLSGNLGDVGALLFVGGMFFTYVFFMLTKVPLVPIGDPRLQRCIQHHQSH